MGPMQSVGQLFVSEYFKMVFLEIPLNENYAVFHLEGHTYVQKYAALVLLLNKWRRYFQLICFLVLSLLFEARLLFSVITFKKIHAQPYNSYVFKST